MVSKYSLSLALAASAIMAGGIHDIPMGYQRNPDDNMFGTEEELRAHRERNAKAEAKRARKAEKLKRQAKAGGFR